MNITTENKIKPLYRAFKTKWGFTLKHNNNYYIA